MARHFSDWLTAFCDYASYTEAPKRMHFWAGVSAIAGALRRKVWIDEIYFQWYPNFYIIFVAPPGVVSKSTTADVAMNCLRKVPGINFGPDIITWQALMGAFAATTESFELNGDFIPQSAITCVASELGNLLNPQDREMVDLLITLWDNKKELGKKTKTSGNDDIEAPWANIIGCTTPSWLLENVPKGMVGGGFTSRCIFVYADKKEKLVAYPSQSIPQGLKVTQEKLIEDLVDMSLNIAGQYTISADAIKWGTEWYGRLWQTYDHSAIELFGNYIARKQTHMHKLAMVLAASESCELAIKRHHLETAEVMLNDMELDMDKVFKNLGKSEASIQADKFIDHIRRKGPLPYEDAYRYVHSHFPDPSVFENVLNGAVKAGYITLRQGPNNNMFIYPAGI